MAKADLATRGVTHILNVSMAEKELPDYTRFSHLEYHFCPVLDLIDVDISFYFEQCFQFIGNLLIALQKLKQIYGFFMQEKQKKLIQKERSWFTV